MQWVDLHEALGAGAHTMRSTAEGVNVGHSRCSCTDGTWVLLGTSPHPSSKQSSCQQLSLGTLIAPVCWCHFVQRALPGPARWGDAWPQRGPGGTAGVSGPPSPLPRDSISFPSTRFTICELVFNLIKIISLLTNKKRKQCSLWGLGKMASLICRMRMEWFIGGFNCGPWLGGW